MKKCNKIIVYLIVVAIILSGCTSKQVLSEHSADTGDSRLILYTTFYPMYFITSEIAGEKAEVINLTPAGVEPHDWEPTAKTIAKMQMGHMFIYNGAGMEAWVDKVTGILSDLKIEIVCASDKLELIKPKEHEHKDDHDDHEDEHEEDTHEHDHGDYDPHVWVSPKRLIQQAQNVMNALVNIDSANADYYKTNYNKLAEKLEKLSNDIEKTIKDCKSNIIVTSHDAFGYLAHDYGLEQIAIRGVSPDDEPSPAKMAELIEECKEHNVKYIFFEKLVSKKLSEILASEVGAKVLVLNAVHGLDDKEAEAGKDYISIMYENLENLKKALNE